VIARDRRPATAAAQWKQMVWSHTRIAETEQSSQQIPAPPQEYSVLCTLTSTRITSPDARLPAVVGGLAWQPGSHIVVTRDL